MNFAIKLNNNSYYPLCKEFLDIMAEEDNLNSLESIDNFTLKHTKLDLIESLKRSNIYFPEDISNIDFVIYYFDNKKNRELKVYTADDADYINLNVIEFIYEYANNKNILNQINNYFEKKNYIKEDLKSFTYILKNGSLIQIFDSLQRLSYLSKRLLKDYIYNDILLKNSVKKLELK